MSVQDLSNTKWTFYSDPSLDNLRAFAIDFKSNEKTFPRFNCGDTYVKYDHKIVYGYEEEKPYLTITSPYSFIFTKTGTAQWDGTVEYSTDAEHWSTFLGDSSTPVTAALVDGEYCVYLRGTGNTHFLSSGAVAAPMFYIKLSTGESTTFPVRCEGNAENLFDYQTVSAGGHPSLTAKGCASLFMGGNTLMVTGTGGYFIYTPRCPFTEIPEYGYFACFVYNQYEEAPQIYIPTNIPAHAFDQAFQYSTLPEVDWDLTHVTSIGEGGFRAFSDCFSPRLVLGPNLTSLGTNAFKAEGNSQISVCYLFTDEDTPQFDVANVATTFTPSQGGAKNSAAYKIYTDNTAIKNAALAKAGQYTTVNVYHIDGSDWES